MRSRPMISALSIATLFLCCATPALAGSKYGNPRTGSWKVEDSFGSTKGGSMTLSKKRQITKLVALPGDDKAEACGKRVELTGKPKLKSYKQFSERWALAKVRGGLLSPTSAKLKVDGTARTGTVKILWNSPKLATPAEFTFGECRLPFTLRAK